METPLFESIFQVKNIGTRKLTIRTQYKDGCKGPFDSVVTEIEKDSGGSCVQFRPIEADTHPVIYIIEEVE